MVWLTVKPSLRAASCCRVECGERRRWCTLQRLLGDSLYGELGVLALLQEGFHLFMGLETVVELCLHLCGSAILAESGRIRR